jgi:drug/metabolite transporter (DMT)-like permease
MSLILAGISALFYGIADFSGGYASNKSPLLSVLVVSQFLGLLLAVAVVGFVSPVLPAPVDLAWGFIAGLCGAAGLFTLYRGIATSIVAIVSPVSALVSAIVPMVYGGILGERPSGFAIAGALVCLPAIVLLSWSSDGDHERKAVRSAMLQGIVAGLGFGCFFVAVSRSSASSGLWPLLASRLASIAVMASALLLRRQRISILRGTRLATVLAGTTDMGANILFLLASRSGMLSLVSVVTSLYPAPTVILGRLVLGQRVPKVRVAGIGLAIAGVAMISLK